VAPCVARRARASEPWSLYDRLPANMATFERAARRLSGTTVLP